MSLSITLYIEDTPFDIKRLGGNMLSWCNYAYYFLSSKSLHPYPHPTNILFQVWCHQFQLMPKNYPILC